MSEKFKTVIELAGKVEWEGGVAEAILSYGITPDELPDDTPAEITEAWQRVFGVTTDIEKIEMYLEEALDEQGEEGGACE